MTVDRMLASDRETWLAFRKNDVTASSVGALMNCHQYISCWQLHKIKTGEISDELEDTGPVQRGRLLEPVAVALMREKNPSWVIDANDGATKVYFRDPDIRLGATPDVFVTDPARGKGIVQIKSVARSVFANSWKADGEIMPPLWIAMQALAEAYLTGSKWAAVAALVVDYGIDLHIVDVPIHEGVIERIRTETKEFWRRIAAGQEPPVDYLRDAEALAGIYSVGNPLKTIDLSLDNRIQEVLSERKLLKEKMGELKDAVTALDAEIVEKLGDAEQAVVPGWRLTRKTINKKSYVVKESSYRSIVAKELAV
jgi:predicted phage-related endonuclease